MCGVCGLVAEGSDQMGNKFVRAQVGSCGLLYLDVSRRRERVRVTVGGQLWLEEGLVVGEAG